MSKLVFLFNDLSKFVVRITEVGYYDTCVELGVAPCRIAKLNGLTATPDHGSLVYIEREVRTFLYTVKPEDEIEYLCKTFGVDKQDLLEYNSIEYIYPYQILEIPLVK